MQNFVFVDYPAPDENLCQRLLHDNTECPVRRNMSRGTTLHHVKPLGAVVLRSAIAPNNTKIVPSCPNGLSLPAGLCTPRPPRFNTCV